jgi:phosphatidylserine/phosphatidylglycerophosphate/cardiolipin synthase-like enzyme
MRLSEVLYEFSNTEVDLFVRSDEQHNGYIESRLPDWIRYTEIDDLHAKAIVAPEFVYLGSANITRGGLTTNRELCEIIQNEYDSVSQFLQHELGFDEGSIG